MCSLKSWAHQNKEWKGSGPPVDGAVWNRKLKQLKVRAQAAIQHAWRTLMHYTRSINGQDEAVCATVFCGFIRGQVSRRVLKVHKFLPQLAPDVPCIVHKFYFLLCLVCLNGCGYLLIWICVVLLGFGFGSIVAFHLYFGLSCTGHNSRGTSCTE
jgi:hypothetical protein